MIKILKKLIICILFLIMCIIIVGIKTLEFTIFSIIIAIPIVILASIPNGIHAIIPVIPDLLKGLLICGFIWGIIDILYLKSILKKKINMKKIIPHLKNIATTLGIIIILVILIALPFLAMAASAVDKDNLAFALVIITGIVGPMYIYSL